MALPSDDDHDQQPQDKDHEPPIFTTQPALEPHGTALQNATPSLEEEEEESTPEPLVLFVSSPPVRRNHATPNCVSLQPTTTTTEQKEATPATHSTVFNSASTCETPIVVEEEEEEEEEANDDSFSPLAVVPPPQCPVLPMNTTTTKTEAEPEARNNKAAMENEDRLAISTTTTRTTTTTKSAKKTHRPIGLSPVLRSAASRTPSRPLLKMVDSPPPRTTAVSQQLTSHEQDDNKEDTNANCPWSPQPGTLSRSSPTRPEPLEVQPTMMMSPLAHGTTGPETQTEPQLSVSPSRRSIASQPQQGQDNDDDKAVGKTTNQYERSHQQKHPTTNTLCGSNQDKEEERNEVRIHLPPHLASHKAKRSSTLHAVVVSTPPNLPLHPEQQENEPEEDESSEDSPRRKSDQDRTVADPGHTRKEDEPLCVATRMTGEDWHASHNDPVANIITTKTSVPTHGQQNTLDMDDAKLELGCLVEIVGGIHAKANKGFHGRVTKLTNVMVQVRIQKKEITIRQTSVRVVGNRCPTTSDETSTSRDVLNAEHSEISTESRAPVVVKTPSVPVPPTLHASRSLESTFVKDAAHHHHQEVCSSPAEEQVQQGEPMLNPETNRQQQETHDTKVTPNASPRIQSDLPCTTVRVATRMGIGSLTQTTNNTSITARSSHTGPDVETTTTTATTPAETTDQQQNTLDMDDAKLELGCLVEIVGGVHAKKHKGFHGRVTKLTNIMVQVLIQKKEITIRQTSVRVVLNHCSTTNEETSTTRDTGHSETITECRAPVVVQTPPPRIRFERNNDTSVPVPSEGLQKTMNPSSVSLRRSTRKQSSKAFNEASDPKNSRRHGTPLQDLDQNISSVSNTAGSHSVSNTVGSSGPILRHVSGPAGGTRQQQRIVTKIRLETKTSNNPSNFLEYWFSHRIRPVEIPIKNEEALNPVEKRIDANGSPYQGSGQCFELISAKVQSDGDSASQYNKAKCLKLYYVNVGDDGHTLQDELNGLANFSALPTSKAVARLELLQSLCCQKTRKKEKISGIHELARDKFELLPKEGNDGCGFICEEYLKTLMTESGVGASAESEPCRRVLAIQVRAVIPTLGIFKGMLIRKRIPRGEAPIQFTPSMQKVGPSLSPVSVNTGILWVTQAGVDPSQFSQFMGRYLDPNLKDPPVKTFDAELQKHKLKKKKDPEDNMILSLWKALGVPWESCVEYSEQSLKRDGIKHSYVRGLSDPTNEMPPGTVLVTGLHDASTHRSVFVTRSPCLVPKDGRVLPHLSEKPAMMSDENWDWLNELPFGAIIFSNASAGMKPLPTHMANGDLDGDLYFVCWSKEILSQLCKVKKIVDVRDDSSSPSINKPIMTTQTTNTLNNDWLSLAQQQMTDMNTLVQQARLISVLWRYSKKVAKDNPDMGAQHSDAQAYGNAYHQALDIGKHGGKVSLPSHLHAGIPENLQCYLEIA